jgi:DNA replicative helicase MCM subunit Mcm2 (Cdc46/Mcm family)
MADKAGFFVPREGTYTRGLGRGIEGLEDLVNTGIVRGNPRGTEVAASQFAKRWRKNYNNFREVMLGTGIPDIENKFFSRNLTREEFNAIKESAKRFPTNKNPRTEG